MTSHHSDILLPRAAWGESLLHTRIAPYVPITIALIGVVAVLSGGIKSRTEVAAAAAVDPMVTSSIAPAMTDADRRRAMVMLDR